MNKRIFKATGDTTASASNTTNKSTGLGISNVVDAAATIANTIAGISDMNKRRLIESNLNLLTAKEKIELAKKIAAQNNRNEQATILINTIMAARNANADREQRSQTVKWIILAAAGVATLALLIFYKTKTT